MTDKTLTGIVTWLKNWFYDKTEIDTILNGKAPTSHLSSTTDYGVGTSTQYGHCKIINNLNQSLYIVGYSLSAYQGKVLKDLIDAKANSTHTHTKSEITDFPNIPSKTSDLTNDGDDGSNVFIKDNDSRLSNNRNPLSNNLAPTSTHLVDLNNVRGTGFYYALGNANIQYVSNLPIDWGNISFYLTVEETNNANYCKQTITSYEGEKMFVRGRVGGIWNVWRQIQLI